MTSGFLMWLGIGWVGLSVFVVWFVWRVGRSTGKKEGRSTAELESVRRTSLIQERQLHEAIDTPFDRGDLASKLRNQGL